MIWQAMEIPAFDTPLEISAVNRDIAITGRDGLCAAFTLEAAKASVRRLQSAIAELEGDDGEIYQKPLG